MKKMSKKNEQEQEEIRKEREQDKEPQWWGFAKMCETLVQDQMEQGEHWQKEQYEIRLTPTKERPSRKTDRPPRQLRVSVPREIPRAPIGAIYKQPAEFCSICRLCIEHEQSTCGFMFSMRK